MARLLALAGGALLALALVLVVNQDQGEGRGGRTTAAPAESRVTEPPHERRPETQSPATSRRRVQGALLGRGRPRALRIASLDVRASVVPVDVDEGVLVPPDDPTRVGWWDEGAVPGAARGSAVLTGHTVSSGGGVFDDLERMRPGQQVSVTTANGVVRYFVDRVIAYRKRSLAEHAARLFSQEIPGRLVLVTCEDWNGEVYLSNQVVVATPLAAS